MKTAIVGGGKGCRNILRLLDAGYLRELHMDVVCVTDTDPQAPGLVFAREKGLQTFADYREGIALPGLELVLELTGRDDVLAEIYHRLPEGVRVIEGPFTNFSGEINFPLNLPDSIDERLFLPPLLIHLYRH